MHAYEQFGDGFVDRLNGMFAFSLWDDARHRLILGRDPVGIKPLYYYAGADLLVFASEVKALFALPSIPRLLDPEAVDEFLTLEYVLAPRTLTKGVRKLGPGCVLVVERGSVIQKRYWTPTFGPPVVDERDAAARVRATLTSAVKRQMTSDVPLGAFLSGGIDSSIIVGLMSEVSGRPVKTFSIGFDDHSYNELEHASLVARHFKTQHEQQILRVDPPNFLDDFQRYLDEPISDVSVIPPFWFRRWHDAT